jgi:hypothetical protein
MASKAGTKAFEHLLNVGADVMAVVLDSVTNAIVAQLGNATTENVDHDGAEWWQHTGWASMPAAPTQGAASCQAIAIRHSDRDMVVASKDLRAAKIYANLKPGECCMYATVGAARQFCKANGHVVQYTTVNNDQTSTSHSTDLGPDGFHLVTSFGALSLDKNGFTVTLGSASITISPTGVITIAGQQVEVNGSVVAVSGVAGTFIGPAATPNPIAAAIYGPAGVMGVASTTVFISP